MRVRSLLTLLAVSLVAACGGGGGSSPAPSIPPAAPVFYATWTASPQKLNEDDPGLPDKPPEIVSDRTIREVVRVSIGGDSLRIKVSNLFGTSAVTLPAVHVARATGNATIDPATDRAVTFAGSTTVTIPAGGEILSDPIALAVASFSDVAVSFYVQAPTVLTTGHFSTTHNAVRTPGNTVASNAAGTLDVVGAQFWLTEIDVSSAQRTNVVVAFGDSITDGSQSTPGAHKSYPEQLAARLASEMNPQIAVVNAGIGGNRWLADVAGPSGNSRFSRDVLGVQGVTHVIIMLGINDFGIVRAFGGAPVTAAQLIAATEAAVAKAKLQRVKVLLGTLLPYGRSPVFNIADEAQRQAYNAWVRQNTQVDGIVDFDLALRDPANPLFIAPQFASPDLHPNDAGYAAMAALVDAAKLR